LYHVGENVSQEKQLDQTGMAFQILRLVTPALGATALWLIQSISGQVSDLSIKIDDIRKDSYGLRERVSLIEQQVHRSSLTDTR